MYRQLMIRMKPGQNNRAWMDMRMKCRMVFIIRSSLPMMTAENRKRISRLRVSVFPKSQVHKMYVTVGTITIRYDLTKYGLTRRGEYWTQVETAA
jgi:hypothetical protein